MPKDKMAMAIMVSMSVKPFARLPRIFRVRFMEAISLFHPLRSGPRISTNATSTAHDGYRATQIVRACGTEKNCAVDGIVGPVSERTGGTKLHSCWSAGSGSNTDRRAISEEHRGVCRDAAGNGYGSINGQLRAIEGRNGATVCGGENLIVNVLHQIPAGFDLIDRE